MDISLLKCFGKFIFINILLSNITLITSEVVFLLSVILIELTASSLFAAFINSKPVGRKTALGEHLHISSSLLTRCSSQDQRHLHSHQQHHLLDSLLLLVGQDPAGLRPALLRGGVRPLLADVCSVSVSPFDNNPYIGSLSSVISPWGRSIGSSK